MNNLATAIFVNYLATYSSIEGFHVRAARQMTVMMPHRKPGGSWIEPDSEKVPKAAGLSTVKHYVCVCRATILC